MTTYNQRVLHQQKLREAFSLWVDALRLKGSMRKLDLERISEEEWKEYEKPTGPCPPPRKDDR
jgi:hypothetical protein